MTLGSIVDREPGPAEDSPGFYGWDWSATTHDSRSEDVGARAVMVRSLVDALGGMHVLPGKGLQGWQRSLEVYDCDGYALGKVYLGGERHDVHVVSTSAAAEVVRSDVLGLGYSAKTARVDTRVDSLVSFEGLSLIMRKAADTYGSRLIYMASEERGRSLGRTLYLGAPTSAIRVRLYEKWLESPGQYVEGTNRVEVQLRPASSVKERVSSWSRAETFCASKVTRELAERLGAGLVPENSLHVAKGTPDLERTLAAMGEQYGRAVDRWLQTSGGDVDRVIEHLVGTVADLLPKAAAG